MVLEHMRRICGRHCFVLGQAVLPEYEIGLDLRGYANIRPAAGEQVYGVLFEIDEEAMAALDRFEGYPEVYNREFVAICDSRGQSLRAWVYIEPAEQFGGRSARQEYFNRVISGAVENRLPEIWIAKIQQLAGSA